MASFRSGARWNLAKRSKLGHDLAMARYQTGSHEAIEESALEAKNRHPQGRPWLGWAELALGFNGQWIGEGVEEVEFAGPGRLKEKDFLWFW